MLRTGKPSAWRSALAALRRTVVVALIGGTGMASAAMVSFNDAAMDSIFSQASFGGRDIDIRFNTALSVVAPSLLSIDSDAEFGGFSSLSLRTLASELQIPKFAVSVFFVDAITYCGGPGGSIIGCGSNPGGLIALQSKAAASLTRGATLLAHELGHNLGLSHLTGQDASGNLMNSSITSDTFLSKSQVDSILKSPIVQLDGTQRYISITPIAVLAALQPVPEPHTWAMLSLGLLGVAGWVRRRRVG